MAKIGSPLLLLILLTGTNNVWSQCYGNSFKSTCENNPVVEPDPTPEPIPEPVPDPTPISEPIPEPTPEPAPESLSQTPSITSPLNLASPLNPINQPQKAAVQSLPEVLPELEIGVNENGSEEKPKLDVVGLIQQGIHQAQMPPQIDLKLGIPDEYGFNQNFLLEFISGDDAWGVINSAADNRWRGLHGHNPIQSSPFGD
jgi:hypothetical protein